jgi:signal transduction histidine kinase
VLLSMRTLRGVVPLLVAGVALLVASVFLVARDVAAARQVAESEIVGLAEAGAAAIAIIPAERVGTYLDDLAKHPSIAIATVYSAGGVRTTRSRALPAEPGAVARLIPSLQEPVLGCRAVGAMTLCLQADPAHFQRRAALLLVPHAVVLGAAALLLAAAIVLARSSGSKELRNLARILKGAAEENNYALRVPQARGTMGEVATAANALLEQMHQRDLMLRRRSTELEAANRELEAFSYSVSHDLRAPLASVNGFSQALRDFNGEQLDDNGREYLRWIEDAVRQMNELVAGLLQMSRIGRTELERTDVDVTAMAESIAEELRQRDPGRQVDFRIQSGIKANADERLLRAVLENLMSNAFKFTRKTTGARVEVGTESEQGRTALFVRDNGAGFDATQAAKMFTPFQRLHSQSDFEGTGIGLSTVKRIVERHGGAIWADGRPGSGAVFHFTLGEEAFAADRTEAQLARV